MPISKEIRAGIAACLIFTAGVGGAAAVVAKSSGLGVEFDSSLHIKGISHTIQCPHPDVLPREGKYTVVFSNGRIETRDPNAVYFGELQTFFAKLLEKYPQGYQIDVINPFKKAPKTTRAGIINVTQENDDMVINFVKKAGKIPPFIFRFGKEVKIEQGDFEKSVFFLGSLFDQYRCEVDHVEIDIKSPYRLWMEGIRALDKYDRDGEMLKNKK